MSNAVPFLNLGIIHHPYKDEFVGVFRADHKNGRAFLHFGTSKDGINFDIHDNVIPWEDEEGILNISLTREELSNIVGTATESIIRLLSEFKSDRLIGLNGRKIKILDKPGLKYTANI